MLQYTMKSFCRFFVAALCFGAAFSTVSPVRAQNAAKPESLKTATTQVDGITSRIVDNLWEESDHYWHEGDYNRIIALVRVCVEVDPSFVEAYSSGAWLMWSQGDTRAADTFLQYGLSRARKPKKAIWPMSSAGIYTTPNALPKPCPISNGQRTAMCKP